MTKGLFEYFPLVKERRGDADAAAEGLTHAVAQLVVAEVEDHEAAYSLVVEAWGKLGTATERLAELGAMIGQDHPTKSKYMVSGSVVELTDNLIETAGTLTEVSGSAGLGPFEHIKGQQQVFEVAAEVISKDYPSAYPRIARELSKLGFSSFDADAVEKEPEPVEESRGERVRILHISDLHRTPDESVSNDEVTPAFLMALRELEKDTGFDLLVLSGDVTQAATTDQYQEAEGFVDAVKKEFLGGDAGRCLIVPGNHDVSWAATKVGGFKVNRHEGGAIRGLGALVNDLLLEPLEGTLPAANDEFNAFHTRVFGRPGTGCSFVPATGANVGFVRVDTTWGMHHLSDEARVDRRSLTEALEEARKSELFLVAVGHHGPVRDKRQHDGLDRWVFDLLLRYGVRLYLHGHVHESCVTYIDDGVARVACVGVGTLVAGPAERPESTPRQYNVIELDLVTHSGRVSVRRKDRRDTAWAPDRRFGRTLDSFSFDAS